jgi:predicted lipid-binding transport protein (Tim44 family)
MAEQTLKRHPIRGFVWGLIAGLGVGLLLTVLSVIALSISTLVVYATATAVLGAVWGLIGPPKKPRGAAPDIATETPAAASDSS